MPSSTWGRLAWAIPRGDLAIVWTLLSGKLGTRSARRSRLMTQPGRNWALWKLRTILVEHMNANPAEAGTVRRVIDEVLADHQHA